MTAYPEPMVARVTGVNRHRLAEARRDALQKDADWTLENSVVSYSAVGLKKLLVALGLSDASFDWQNPACATGDRSDAPPRTAVNDPKKSGDAAAAVAARIETAGVRLAARPVVDLVVVSLSRNPSIVHATTDGGTPVLVRVRSNENFIAGMPLRARAPAPGSTLYYFEGNCPRWKGRY